MPGVWTLRTSTGTRQLPRPGWYQTVLTKSGTTYSLYIDGQFECQQTISAAAEYNDNVGLIIGSITPINPPYPDTFFGRLDDFRVYSRALSSNEVAELYAYESVPASPPPQDQAPFTNSLVAYYPFNGNASDASGNGNNGTLFGATGFGVDRFGNDNACLALPGKQGNGSGVDVPSLNDMPYRPVTYSAWFWLSNYPPVSDLTVMNLVGREVCGDQSAGCLCLASATAMGVINDFDYFCGGIGFPTTLSATMNQLLSPPINQWCEVVLTLDQNGNGTFYLNGSNRLGFASAPAGQPADFRIGASAGGGCGYEYVWNGLIDDVRIYNRDLSSNEVQELYAYESAPLAPCVPYPATATATVVNGFVVGATVNDGGCGYTNTPVVLFVGGGGTGAMGTAVVSNGVVVGITVSSAGSGYTNTPVIDIYSSLVPTSQIGLIQAVIPTFSGLTSGLTYQLQVSTDLNTWNNAGSSFVATNASMVYPLYFGVTNWNELYFRLQASP